MMNDAVCFSNDALPIVISLDDIDDADDAADTMKWCPDAAVTQVMPATARHDVKRYLRATGRSFRTNVVLSMALLTGIVAAILAANI